MNRDKTHMLVLVLEHTQCSIPTTKLISKTNTNHKRLMNLLDNLTCSKMVVSFDNTHVITEKGRVYLESWKKFHDFAQSFGLDI